MKNLLTLLAACLLSLNALAQAPPYFSYQAVLRDPNGNFLVLNRTVGMRISILQGSITGPAVYVERHTPTTGVNGLFTLDIGRGTALSGTLGSIGWSRGPYFLKTEADLLGGTNYTIIGTSELLSVPYAMYAGSAGHHIGELFGGGIIFSLWRDHLGVEHGLIASLADLGTRVWAVPDITVGASSYDGAGNTAAIVGTGGVNTAAGLCDNYISIGSFTDWYLPAAAELNLLYQQAVAIRTVLENDNNPLTSGVNAASYWSSTFCSRINSSGERFAFKQFINSIQEEPGRVELTRQNTSAAVRAIRRF